MQNTILERSVLCVHKKAMENHKIIKFYEVEGDGRKNIYSER